MTETPTTDARTKSPRRRLVEALAAFAFVTVVAAALYRVHALGGWFHAIVAALFLYVPAALLWREGRELEDYGLTVRPLLRGVALALVAVVLIFPLFALGFALWQELACMVPILKPLAPGPCVRGAPALGPFLFRLPPGMWKLAAAELVVVALPEEFFFRGYLQGRLEELWPARRRLLGAPVGRALVVSSALFALCHLAVQGNPATLAVFFPGLVFGWMRARTRSILAGVLFHASCNLYIEVLHRSFFG